MDRETRIGFMTMAVLLVGVFTVPFILRAIGWDIP